MMIKLVTILILLVAAIVDYKKGEIPDWLTLPSLILLAGYRLYRWEIGYIGAAIYIAVGLTVLALMVGGIGGGDLKLLSVLGLAVGFPTIGWIVLLAFLLAIVYSMIKKENEIKMGPIIFLAYLSLISF